MTPTANNEWITKLVPIDKLIVDHAMQVRGGIDSELVIKYAEIIREQEHMDPVTAFRDGGARLLMADGFHRISAYQQEGRDKIPCRFKDGTATDALRFALKENGRHGAQMTNEQKRHAATMAVEDPILGLMTDKDIAKMVGCSATLVGQCRRGESKEAVAEKTRQRKQRAEASTPPPEPAASRETESPAPPSASARQRKETDNRPTKKAILRQIQDYLTNDVIDEQDVIDLMKSATGEYHWIPKDGQPWKLRVVGKSGRLQTEIDVAVKDVTFEMVTLKFEGPGKVLVEE